MDSVGSGDIDGFGRNLLNVLGVNTIQAAMAALSTRCNGTGKPNFSGLALGDYIDGIDLSAIPAENSGTAGQPWNDTYKNNRIVIAGFNTYKGMGDAENAKNHILFTFRDIPLNKCMNSSNDNTGGYRESELRAFLEGMYGNGTGDKSGVTTAAFMNALKAQIGNYLYSIRKLHSTKSSNVWSTYTVWLPSEIEVFGVPCYGDEGVYMPAITSPTIAARVGGITPIQIPLYQKSFVYRTKRYNGSKQLWWLQTPYSSAAGFFAYVNYNGYSNNLTAASVGGCAPDSVKCNMVDRYG
ncbi:MAG: DUF6273 domain-containing protein [Spirochaetaceae bacterium]|nr:DUF6273 domain-containing protein [Spirochaetaceae bacterium]